LNILSVGGNYKPGNGGNAKRISTMCEMFVSLGHSVTVMTCTEGQGAENECINGVRIKRFADYKELSKNIKNCISVCEIDVVLVHQETFLRNMWLQGIRVPVFFECHAIEPNPNKAKEAILKILSKCYLRKRFVRSVFVLSKNAIPQFSKAYNYPVESIFWTPNGFEAPKCKDAGIVFGDQETFTYGYAGTLYTFQGIENILTYSKEILAIGEDVRLMLVGGGPLEETVRKFVEENGLSDKILLTGSVDRKTFDEYMATFDVVLMPRPSMSSTESAVPLKVFDAVKHRKPVVMSNVSGLTEAFSENAALIYDTKRPHDFVECCRKIYRNRPLAEALVAGASDAMKNWPTVEDVANTQLNVMKAVLANNDQ